MSAVTGPGSGPDWSSVDATPDADTVNPTDIHGAGFSEGDATALLDALKSTAASQRTSLPTWLARRLDSAGNVNSVVTSILRDGKVTGAEVKRLVKEAADYGNMNAAEKRALTGLLNGHADKFEPVAREALAKFLGVANPLPFAPLAPTTPVTPTDPTTPTTPTTPVTPTGPVPTDLVPKAILEKHGLSTTDMTTSSKYEGHEWSVGYFPYSGDTQYVAFGKFQEVFGKGGEDGQAYFEFYSNPPGGLEAGSWIKSGHISESNFEMTAGVDVTANRPIGDDAYKALRNAGAPASAKFALLDAQGKAVAFGPNDKLVPTVMKDGKPVETDDRSSTSGVEWRVKRPDGSIDGTGVAKSRDDVLGLNSNVKFDFLDATGRMVGFSPPSDKIAETFEKDGKWHAFVKRDDGKFDYTVLDGTSVSSRETIDAAAKTEKTAGQDIIHRVQDSRGQLKGDGKVSENYNMSWWGKCHNVASLSTSNIPLAKETVRVVNNLAAGDTLALQYGNTVLKPKADGTYEKQTRNAQGAVSGTTNVSAEEAKNLATQNDATAVIVTSRGDLKKAEFTTFTPTDTNALTSHIGNGAVQSVGGEGQRYYSNPDILVMKDGRQIQAHIKELKTEGGKTESIGRRKGHEYEETDRSALRAPGMDSRVLNGGGRAMAFNVQDMSKLNEFREDDVKTFVVIHPDGREEEIDAADVNLLAWENKHDFSPADIWKLHGTVNEKGSSVAEIDLGTMVWNYATRSVDTQVIDPKTLTEAEKKEAAKPGMAEGSIGEEGKHYFSTKINTDGGSRDVKYWVRFDDDGNVKDYSYLGGKAPMDFSWTQHVKNPYESTWTGASQAPGISNAEIQRIYLASQGALSGSMLPGGFISASDLRSAATIRP